MSEQSARFTPGPWELETHHDGLVPAWYVSKNKVGIATQPSFSDPSNEQANARLIAAAPDLLDALTELADLMQGVIDGEYKPDSFTLQPARAAIARAEGRAP